jgi:hypothetical protein
MIRTDITTLVFFYILFSVIGIFIIWVILGYKRIRGAAGGDVKTAEHAWKCSICLHAYIDSLHEDISICPLCGSYNKRT